MAYLRISTVSLLKPGTERFETVKSKNLIDQILNELKLTIEKKSADEILQRLVLKIFGLFFHRNLQMALKSPEAKIVASLRTILNQILDGIQSKFATVAIAAYEILNSLPNDATGILKFFPDIPMKIVELFSTKLLDLASPNFNKNLSKIDENLASQLLMSLCDWSLL